MKYPSRQQREGNIGHPWFGAENWSFSVPHAGFDVAHRTFCGFAFFTVTDRRHFFAANHKSTVIIWFWAVYGHC
jgi:hypothetical protein